MAVERMQERENEIERRMEAAEHARQLGRSKPISPTDRCSQVVDSKSDRHQVRMPDTSSTLNIDEVSCRNVEATLGGKVRRLGLALNLIG